MKKLSLCVFTTLLLVLNGSCQTTASVSKTAETPHGERRSVQDSLSIDADTLASWLLDPGHRLVLYDVRLEQDVQLGMIPGARYLDYDDALEAPDSVAIPDSADVVVYCYSGIRSRRLVNAMREFGIRAVTLQGGIHAWERLLRQDPGLVEKIRAVRPPQE